MGPAAVGMQPNVDRPEGSQVERETRLPARRLARLAA